jgi:hypothetical protein
MPADAKQAPTRATLNTDRADLTARTLIADGWCRSAIRPNPAPADPAARAIIVQGSFLTGRMTPRGAQYDVAEWETWSKMLSVPPAFADSIPLASYPGYQP